MTTTTEQLEQTPAEPSPVKRTAKQLKRARRRRAVSGYWKQYKRSRPGMIGLTILVTWIVLALLAPFIIDTAQIEVANATGDTFQEPGAGAFLGTDKFGRDVFAMLIYGARISLLVGFTATIGTMIIGLVVGLSAGYFGGKTDTTLNLFTDWFLVLPWIPLAIVLVSLLGQSLINIIMVIALTSWAGTARLIRAQAKTVKERTYVERARALGSGHWHMMTRHMLPNVFPVLFSNTVLAVSLAILSETTLAILGLGDPNSVSWGTIIGESFDEGALTAGIWWWLIPPGLALISVTLSFTMCGYALDDILNPKLRQR